MRLSLKEIEARVAPLGNQSTYTRDFIFDLLEAYGRSPGNITRLRSTSESSLNVAVDPTTEVAQKGIVYFKELPQSSEEELLGAIEALSTSAAAVRYSTRFVIVTDYRQLLAKDTKTDETLFIDIRDIPNHFTFFLPWAGMEKAQYTAEAHADVKAAERMAKLFDELVKLNPDATETQEGRHSLNVFFTRLLFCFFAEDTDIFEQGQFTNAAATLTREDGSDLQDFLADLFRALDTQNPDEKPNHLKAFPYVNGRLFQIKPGQKVPTFNKKARDYLVESGKLQWSQINPDIFGSMFQAIVTPGQRSELGQHYTSVPNILKTIEPLFLDELKAEFDNAFDNAKKLEALLARIGKIKIFDPACGSGNFLIIAYKELRKLEHAILERLGEIRGQHHGLFDSVISIENFFGIELDDFAVEVAILSLWIAKHQMNVEFKHKFGTNIPLIPLTESGHIKHGNANRIDWNEICPNDRQSEIYLIGNPPYKGAKNQNAEMKDDFPYVFGNRPYSKNLDYIALWFVKGSDYIVGTHAQLAFVTTNSVSQGEHVGLMFPLIFGLGLEIGYAFTSFEWSNNARTNAGVTVAVINLRNPCSKQKLIFTSELILHVENINGYLADGPNIWLERSARPISSNLPEMVFGSMPRDGGGLVLTPEERGFILEKSPEARRYMKRYFGTTEFIDGIERYCLWIVDGELASAKKIPAIQDRLQIVHAARRASPAKSTASFANQAHRFVQISYKPTESIIVPRVTTERRNYIPMAYLGPDSVISDSAFAIYDAKPWVFAVLMSRMHVAWVRAVGGRFRTGYRYSNTIVYNNFPFPTVNEQQKDLLDRAAFRILDVREYHSELRLADLYDPDKMPENLQLAHEELDALVDSIYRKREFASDEERLSLLFEMYLQMSESGEK